jgi:aryl-alcohol dehydrogenase-like predicted oxidoreductase
VSTGRRGDLLMDTRHHPRPRSVTRRDLVKGGLALGALLGGLSPRAFAQQEPLIRKKIPSTGETLPVIGIGTARRYDVGSNAAERAELKEVLRRFVEAGGKVIDTAPSYGSAESVVGDLAQELRIRDSLFIATKVGARDTPSGRQQIEESFRRLRAPRIDCIAVHNLMNTAAHLAVLRELKAAGRIRYVGLSTSFKGQYPEFEQVMKTEALDFVQVDYALDHREAADRIIPLAADRGAGVMVNLPFGRGRLFEAVRSTPLPEWAREFDCQSWAQFFLKYVVSHPAVTCAIPGTAQTKYLSDNLGAARGRLPDAAMRTRMAELIDRI